MLAPQQRTILVVDDDPIILIALRETLEPEGYTVQTFERAREALQYLKEHSCQVILSDQRMPEMTGLEFLGQVKVLRPEASRILITGVLSLNTIIEAVNRGEIFRFLAKPWLREELLATVHNAQQRSQLYAENLRLQADTQRLNAELRTANAQLEGKLDELEVAHRQLDRHHSALQVNFDSSVDTCFRLLEAYHPLLGHETRQTVAVCQRVLEAGSFDDRQRHILGVSAWLYQIGLVKVHRETIHAHRNHPQKLTREERASIERAPLVAQSLASFVDHLKEVGVTIRAQDERWDGRGYPDGLAGDLIPPMARYLAIAAFYARSATSREEALERIVAESGRAFEPDAVRLFLKANRVAPLPDNVREVLLDELQPGMTLARDLHSAGGLLLVPEGRRLDPVSFEKVREFNHVNPLTQRILVYC